MSWNNYIEIILVMIAIPLLIYIFIRVRKMDKEMKEKREELMRIYGNEKRGEN